MYWLTTECALSSSHEHHLMGALSTPHPTLLSAFRMMKLNEDHMLARVKKFLGPDTIGNDRTNNVTVFAYVFNFNSGVLIWCRKTCIFGPGCWHLKSTRIKRGQVRITSEILLQNTVLCIQYQPVQVTQYPVLYLNDSNTCCATRSRTWRATDDRGNLLKPVFPIKQTYANWYKWEWPIIIQELLWAKYRPKTKNLALLVRLNHA